MSTALQARLASASECEVRYDAATRQLYSTDASHYRIEPQAVAFPETAAQASAIIRAAAVGGISIAPRGAGSGLTGGALGDGLVIDFARYNQHIWDLDLDARTVKCGAGVVLDQLNACVRPHGLGFGPDVATSSRATIGGMIANNSSGARTPLYGTTADHVAAVECVLADGRIAAFDSESSLANELLQIREIVALHAPDIEAAMPPNLLKRWPGYALDRFLREPTLANVLAGSEGTLAGIMAAQLKLVPLPKESGLALLFFNSVAEAMQATVELLPLEPAAIEHIDDVLTNQTRGQRQFQAARDLLELDLRPCKSILVVEFFDHVAAKLESVQTRSLGLRSKAVTSAREINLVWSLRKAGLALLTGCKGRAKPVTCIEDAAVQPRHLPAYVAALEAILKPLGVDACFYGHAASGLLHVRPVLDLHTEADRRKFRHIATEVSEVVRQFKGSLAAEHGVGIARTEFMRDQLGDSLLRGMRAIKHLFDPGNILNPGKIFDDGRYRLDTRLRSSEIELPFEPVLAFASRDESFLGNLEQCNGCGGCRKTTPTMCPTFLSTGEEGMSTRGRANIIRAALEKRFDNSVLALELQEALESCLSCKACTNECPSNVNMALLKAELRHAAHKMRGLGLSARLLSRVDLLGALGTLAPAFANSALDARFARGLMQRLLGITDQRPLPAFTTERFDSWFYSRSQPPPGRRGRVLLWDDCFVRYYEPRIGRAAVKVLECAGYEVALARGRACCGRPAFSQGNLDEARRMGRHNVELLHSLNRRNPFDALIFLEPSCFSMFAEDYRELRIDHAGMGPRPVLFEHFINDLLARDPNALPFNSGPANVAIHVHCHAKALTDTSAMARLASRIPGALVSLLDTGCCGMAGAFGAMQNTYKLSLQVAAPLVSQIQKQPPGAVIVASGTSCRQQIEHAAETRAVHMAELLAQTIPARV